MLLKELLLKLKLAGTGRIIALLTMWIGAPEAVAFYEGDRARAYAEVCASGGVNGIIFYQQIYDFQTEAYEKWLVQAEGGDVNAQFNFARMYYEGCGVVEDKSKARNLMQKVAESEDAEAQVLMGVFYKTGKGGELNPQKSLEWFLKGADNGNRIGQMHVFGSFYHGNGVEVNLSEAGKYYSLAQAQDDSYGDHYVWRKTTYLIEGEQESTLEMNEVPKYLYLAKWGSALAQYEYGNLYYKGLYGVEKNYELALMWYLIAAQNMPQKGSSYGLRTVRKNIKKFKEELSNIMSKSSINNSKNLATRCLETNFSECETSWWRSLFKN